MQYFPYLWPLETGKPFLIGCFFFRQHPINCFSYFYSTSFALSNLLLLEMAADWWHNLSEEVKKARRNCVKIYVLSPFLFAVVPPGHEDKVCSGLLTFYELPS